MTWRVKRLHECGARKGAVPSRIESVRVRKEESMSVSFRARKEVRRFLLVGLTSGLLLLSPAGAPLVPFAMGDSIEELREKLKSKKAGDRRKAARELGETLSREATPPLLGAVGDKDPEVRRAAVKSLGLIRDTGAVTMLLKALEDGVPEVRREAVIALVNLYTEKDASSFLAREAKRLYARLNPFSGPVPSDDTVIEPDVKVAPAVIDGIAARLRDSHREVRFYAANALGVLRGQAAIPRMVEGMNGAEPNLQVAILRAFYKIRDRSVAGEVQPYLLNTNKKVRDEALLTLGLFKSQEALPQIQTLYDQNPGRDVRLNCLEAMALIGAPSSLPVFRRHLSDGGPRYRQFAAEGIGRAGDASVAEDVSRAFLAEKKPAPRLAMSFALYSLDRKEYLDQIVAALKERTIHQQAQAYLLELKTRVAPELVNYLNDSNPLIRRRLCLVLGQIGDSATAEKLRPLLKDDDTGVVSEATRALRRIGAR